MGSLGGSRHDLLTESIWRCHKKKGSGDEHHVFPFKPEGNVDSQGWCSLVTKLAMKHNDGREIVDRLATFGRFWQRLAVGMHTATILK